MSNDHTILLVEDDTFLIDILVQKFQSDGYEVIHAGDGEAALEKAHENSPDLIFLDIILPGMNGFEVLKQLKEDEKIKDIPVAFLSNLGQKEDIEKGKRLGAVDFIVKANHSLEEIVDKAGELLTKEADTE
jgi:CheY-like chemotaxis protein